MWEMTPDGPSDGVVEVFSKLSLSPEWIITPILSRPVHPSRWVPFDSRQSFMLEMTPDGPSDGVIEVFWKLILSPE